MTKEELAKVIREDYERKGVWAIKTTTLTMKLDFEALGIILEALEESKWIPVSERLPEDYDRYLITTKDGRVETIYYGYTDDRPNEIAFHQWDDDGWQCWKPDVTAWMLLPAPFEPQERSGEK